MDNPAFIFEPIAPIHRKSYTANSWEICIGSDEIPIPM